MRFGLARITLIIGLLSLMLKSMIGKKALSFMPRHSSTLPSSKFWFIFEKSCVLSDISLNFIISGIQPDRWKISQEGFVFSCRFELLYSFSIAFSSSAGQSSFLAVVVNPILFWLSRPNSWSSMSIIRDVPFLKSLMQYKPFSLRHGPPF